MERKSIDCIFWEAANIATPAEREAYLQGACGENAELRRKVEQLLQAQSKARHFLESPAGFLGGTLAETTSAPSASVILAGRYRLVEPMGEGGMGTVWRAQQTEPVKRPVALKVIKAGMDSGQVLARFEAERQALALMDHPNIARVLDAGTTDSGQPFFVMELIEGVSITAYCDQYRLTPRQRLELFVQVCQAVQHAHQKGVIHRDIKPSNVLVGLYDGVAAPKVIDFGVAKAIGQPLTEQTLQTAFGAVVGTVEYMSPEQASFNQLDVDTRSDIYSLGVLLYELLTGSPPFCRKEWEKAGLLEMLRAIREQEPTKPSTKISTAEGLPALAVNRGTQPNRLTKLVRGEVDWIVMKALEKDRTRRYETANAFAQDVQRYLLDEPVQACPPSRSYRLRKLIRRNRAALTIAAVVLMALAFSVGAIGWAIRNAVAWQEKAVQDHANRIAQIELEDAARRASLEQQVSLVLAEAEASYHLDKFPEAFAALRRAEELIASTDTDAHLRRGVARRRAELVMAATLEDIPLRQFGNPEVIGSSNADRDRAYREAFRRYGLDVETMDLDRVVKAINNSTIRATLLTGIDLWAKAKTWGGIPGAKELFDVSRRVDPDELRNRLRYAIQQQDRVAMREIAQSEGFQNQPPATVVLLARTISGDQKNRDPKDVQAAVEVLRSAQRRHPHNFWLNRELAFNLFLLSRYEQKREGFLEAVGFARAAVAIRPEEAGAYTVLGDCLYWIKNPDETEAAYREALRRRPDLYHTLCNLGAILNGKGKLLEAAIQFREAIKIWPNDPVSHNSLERILGRILTSDRVDLENATARCTLGTLYHALGRYDEASTEYQSALRLEPDHAQTHYRLGILRETQGQVKHAIDQYERAVKLDPQDLAYHLELARVLTVGSKVEFRNPNRALGVARAAVELSPDSADAWRLLGWAHYRMRDWNESIRSLEKSVSLQTNPRGGDPRQWFILAGAHWRLGNEDEARALYHQGERWMKEANASRNEELRGLRAEFESLLSREQVVAWASEAISTQADSPEARVERAVIHARLGDMEKAAKCFDEALTAVANNAGDEAMRDKIYLSLFESEPTLGRLVMRRRTEDASLWTEHGRFLALRARWKEAAEAFTQAGNSAPWFESAAVLLLADDVAGYRAFCARLNQQHGENADPGKAWQLVSTCALSPESGIAPARLVEWGESSLTQSRHKFRLLTVASAEYRAGQYEQAIEHIQEALDGHKAVKSNVAFLMALCHHQSGREAQSRQWYDVGRQSLKEIAPRIPGTPVSWALKHWLNVNVWAREAEHVLQERFGPVAGVKRPPT